MSEPTTTDHWWWRPGWRVGRSFYTWHFTFEHSAAVQALVPRFAPALAELPTYDPVTESGLHITTQGVGFTDEVSDTDLGAVVDAAKARCSALARFDTQLGPVAVDAEALGLPVANPDGLRGVRAALQAAIGDVWGTSNIPEAGTAFRPHLTLAYSAGVVAIPDVLRVLDRGGVSDLVVTDRIATVSLINLNRDNKRYEWTDVATVHLGSR
jgi:2'-5' RNA ligase